jgi:serine/threonine protein kinase
VATVEKTKRIGNYDVLARIGEGGAGTVYKAQDRDSGEVVAVKVMPPDLARNPVLRQRFQEEFRAASQLEHPNIVRAIRYHDEERAPFLVMEYVEGESLGERLEHHGRMEEAEAVRIILQVCDALAQAHRQGIIHRDVKPDNIMVSPDGQAKLADLGLVKRMEAELDLTRTGRGLGTPHFMAPEQFRNAKGVDPRCDIYSLGATLYMMVTGKLPFHAKGPFDTWAKKVKGDLVPARNLAPGLSMHVDAAIEHAVNPNPSLRPATCEEFADEVRGKAPIRVSVPAGAEKDRSPWYVVYQDGKGTEQTVSGTLSEVRRALVKGQLGDVQQARASRNPRGPFQTLECHADLQDLLALGLTNNSELADTVPLNANSTPVGATATTSPSTGDRLQTALVLVVAAAAAAALGHLLFGS